MRRVYQIICHIIARLLSILLVKSNNIHYSLGMLFLLLPRNTTVFEYSLPFRW